MKTSPEQKELNKKSETLLELGNRLSETELEFISLQSELLTFQQRYTDLVVRRMYDLDRIELEIAQHLASSDPTNPEYRQRINKFKEQVAETKKSFADDEKTISKSEFNLSASLKSLYREAAKKIHPDLVINEKERQRRTKIMTKLNEAYQSGDAQRIEQILSEWQYDPEMLLEKILVHRLSKSFGKLRKLKNELLLLKKKQRC